MILSTLPTCPTCLSCSGSRTVWCYKPGSASVCHKVGHQISVSHSQTGCDVANRHRTSDCIWTKGTTEKFCSALGRDDCYTGRPFSEEGTCDLRAVRVVLLSSLHQRVLRRKAWNTVPVRSTSIRHSPPGTGVHCTVVCARGRGTLSLHILDAL